ncbi:MAG: hypothetical protein WA419_20155 [Silvibacterium sp.]
MFRFKTFHLFLLLGLIAPVPSFASASYCIAVDNGFGHGGTTFVEPLFTLPPPGNCNPWSGFTKTASTVILTTSGGGCLSSDGKALTLNVSSADPDYLGGGKAGLDYIKLLRSSSSVSFLTATGEDVGAFGGSAKLVTCTSSLLNLPSSHD